MTYPTRKVSDGSAPDLPLDQDTEQGTAARRYNDMESVSPTQGNLDLEFRRKLPDPEHPWLLSPPPSVTLATLIAELARAEAPNRARDLAEATDIAAYLRSLYQAMAPRPFDLHVHDADPKPVLLRRLIDRKIIGTHPSATGCWISAGEARIFIPPGKSLNDPTSAWYADPDDWIDRDEIEVLISKHRRIWPKLYGESAPASRSAASL